MNDSNSEQNHEHNCRYQLLGNVNETFFDDRHRVIGDLQITRNWVHWTPDKSDVVYELPIEELVELVKQHCADPEKQIPRTDYFHEYAPLKPWHELKAQDLTPEQLARLRRLNARLTEIEKQLASEVQPQLTLLNTRVADPNDWLQDYECECDLKFSIGESDPDYDAENSENVIEKLDVYFSRRDAKDALMMNGFNWNEFKSWEGHPMRDEVHCYLYHSLYDHTCMGWANILRIDEAWIDIKYTYQRWEKKLGG